MVYSLYSLFNRGKKSELSLYNVKMTYHATSDGPEQVGVILILILGCETELSKFVLLAIVDKRCSSEGNLF